MNLFSFVKCFFFQVRFVMRWWTQRLRRPHCSRNWTSSPSNCPRSSPLSVLPSGPSTLDTSTTLLMVDLGSRYVTASTFKMVKYDSRIVVPIPVKHEILQLILLEKYLVHVEMLWFLCSVKNWRLINKQNIDISTGQQVP